MSDLDRQWIEVFRAGDYGSKGNWTAADLDQLAQSYDPAKHAAPVVIGHPQHDAPAWAWVKKLRRVGESLWARLEKVAPEFEELVRQGRFLQRSVAFYKKFALTGRPYLRHLAFLGAQPPEVKGLQPIAQLAEGGSALVEFSESAPLRSLKPYIPFTPPLPGTVVVGMELAEEAEELAQTEKIEFGEAVDRVRRKGKPKVPFTPPLGKMVVVNVELAEEAEELAQTEKIEFGEAVDRVRRKGKPKVPFTPPLGKMVVVNVELAEEAEELAQTEKIEFGEALRRARQERASR